MNYAQSETLYLLIWENPFNVKTQCLHHPQCNWTDGSLVKDSGLLCLEQSASFMQRWKASYKDLIRSTTPHAVLSSQFMNWKFWLDYSCACRCLFPIVLFSCDFLGFLFWTTEIYLSKITGLTLWLWVGAQGLGQNQGQRKKINSTPL